MFMPLIHFRFWNIYNKRVELKITNAIIFFFYNNRKITQLLLFRLADYFLAKKRKLC